ncbi:MAG: hypothetical protein QFF03_11670 [Pseudomonadota bacterium]|nr:hypothetical protein [Pseudomonadota bacterium]
MARTNSVGKILLLGSLAVAGLAQAQQTPSSAPPKLERIEETADTPITVTTPAQRTTKKITEKRAPNGQVTEVEVKTGKSSYTMKAKPPGAVAQPGDASGGTLRPPQWKVLEFDFGKKKQKELDEAAAAAVATAPPPPPLTPAK